MGCACRPLPRRFFQASPLQVAPALLGKLIVRRWRGRRLCARIVETEAYLGADDAAAHAARGLTPRTAVLFGPPGHAYIYLSYGIHWCLNVSTRPAGEPGGVLLRAAQALPPGQHGPEWLRGPGKLARGLHIGARLLGADLTRTGPLYLADDGAPAGLPVAAALRVGIRQARHLPYRFFLEGHPAVSAPRRPAFTWIASRHSSQLYSGILDHGH